MDTIWKMLAGSVLGFGILALVAASHQPAQANVWNILGAWNWPIEQPAHVYAVETNGHNLRVYEWAMKSVEGVHCVAVFGEKGPTGLQCIGEK